MSYYYTSEREEDSKSDGFLYWASMGLVVLLLAGLGRALDDQVSFIGPSEKVVNPFPAYTVQAPVNSGYIDLHKSNTVGDIRN
jgi:hypothetical protein